MTWLMLHHNLAHMEVVARAGPPARAVEDDAADAGGNTQQQPPVAVSAAVAGQWRALREVARLAMVGRTPPEAGSNNPRRTSTSAQTPHVFPLLNLRSQLGGGGII